MNIEEKSQEIVDPKTRYLIKTLSRTNRKDYENYVINAIWHRLNNVGVEVVSQQYVRNRDSKNAGSHYFIDLYFPTLNIGIECDEAYHKNQSLRDKAREVTIYDVLYEITSDAYTSIRIDVTQSFDRLQEAIDKAVERIRQRIRETPSIEWKIKAEEYYSDKSAISISDKKGFKSINSTCNVLFNAGRNESSGGASRAYFALPKFKGTSLDGYVLWFAKLAIPIKNDDGSTTLIAASSAGWKNRFEEDGETIIESHDEVRIKPDGRKRITFVKYKDPLGYDEYKFVGVFQFQGRTDDDENRYQRVATEIGLIKT